jgi:beta-alanine--pyruvate transaminase
MALDRTNPVPNDLSAFWMPFTANRQFKKIPRMFVSADRMHYKTADGREVLDGTAGCGAATRATTGRRSSRRSSQQAGELDYAPAFQMGHPKAFELANRLRDMAPEPFEHVFFTNSGSESVETALKIAIAYQRAIGQGTRTRLIGRERGYHGVNFGGISVGGIVNNRKFFGSLLTGVDHLPHTHLPEQERLHPRPARAWRRPRRRARAHRRAARARDRGRRDRGADGGLHRRADPAQGLPQALREICTKHGILLIFDEVITGFGRLGSPFAAEHFDVMPDLITCAKGLTNGVIPMGAVLATKEIHDAFMQGPST